MSISSSSYWDNSFEGQYLSTRIIEYGCVKMSSNQIVEDSLATDCDKRRKLFEITRKGKLKWLGNFESLQKFVEDVIDIKAK